MAYLAVVCVTPWIDSARFAPHDGYRPSTQASGQSVPLTVSNSTRLVPPIGFGISRILAFETGKQGL
ncbi:hypothetical protein PTT_19657 [Pyrenophora teres f. teres 0-1]|uniref:Uncharacterized protein n=1 Tax=Pyrenophora teres f. teres (strain 0-1) TaxID=861557 RepID=E3S9E8_PYRTT|nr:hypothetical protein PTT_19657 [Pyrenophora teres f. teres 0-1]